MGGARPKAAMANKVQPFNAPVLLRHNQRSAFDRTGGNASLVVGLLCSRLLHLQAGDRVGRGVAQHNLAQEVHEVPGLVLGHLHAKVVGLEPFNQIAQQLFLPNDVLGLAGLAHAQGDVFLRRAYNASRGPDIVLRSIA